MATLNLDRSFLDHWKSKEVVDVGVGDFDSIKKGIGEDRVVVFVLPFNGNITVFDDECDGFLFHLTVEAMKKSNSGIFYSVLKSEMPVD